MKLEKRFTIKILAHKIKKYFPIQFYNFFLLLRFYAFKKHCNKGMTSKITYSDGSWISRKTTSDLRKIQTYLSGIEESLEVLQIGIGNSSLYRVMESTPMKRLVGVTIVDDELNYAASEFPEVFNDRYKVFVANKYSDDIKEVGENFDFIVDNDISSYSCCNHHFLKMLANYYSLLKPGGTVLVGLKGLGYFDSGFGLTEAMMERLAKEYKFGFSVDQYCYRLTRKV